MNLIYCSAAYKAAYAAYAAYNALDRGHDR
jgi:hypothetical protein